MLIVLMAIVNGVKYAMDEDPETGVKTTDTIRDNLGKYIGQYYQFALGEIPFEEYSYVTWIVYVIFTLLIQIVALNLLIAILSQTFAEVYETMNANHCRSQV